jgi:serine/threonine protein kinase
VDDDEGVAASRDVVVSSAAERHARVKQVFLAVQPLSGPERAAALERECGDDTDLRKEVEALLHHDVTNSLIDGKPVATVDPVNPKDPLQLEGVTLDERYKVEHLAGEGGFAWVYRAQHVHWNRPVAVKIFRVEHSGREELKAAFLKEGALLNDLSKKTTAIVQSYDVGTWADSRGEARVFLVLEWLNGQVLSKLIKATGAPWPIDRVLELLAPIAEALSVAHQNGVAHRDVKPANIFVVEDGARQVAKLLDFGVAKVAAEHDGGFLGTGGKVRAFSLGYAPPELLLPKYGTTGPWSDVYSLATVVTEMLLGRRPIDSDDPVLYVQAAVNAPVHPALAKLGERVTPAVREVLAKSLQREAKARPPDAAVFWSALSDAAGKKPGLFARLLGKR